MTVIERIGFGLLGLCAVLLSTQCMNYLPPPETVALKTAWAGMGLMLLTGMMFVGVATLARGR